MKNRRLIITEAQMKKLSEDTEVTRANVTVPVAPGSTPESTYNQTTAKTGDNTTVNIQSPNTNGDMAGTIANVNSKDSKTWDPANRLWQRGANIQVATNESISFTKKQIKEMQLKNAKRITKENFEKELKEEYFQFNKRLNERRKKYGK